ncbi:MAG: hypothetical protein H0U53_07010 [Actinobacteria bacterium]|nr:hypothetical protein [Actinomycetota bacterium]
MSDVELTPPVRPLLPPMRRTSSIVAEYAGVILTPVLFVAMLISLRHVFDGPNWECSGDGCLEEFDRLRGWSFPIPLFVMMFVSTFGFVASLLLYLWGRSGRPPSFDAKQRRGRPALTGVPRTLSWVGLLELSLAVAFAFAGSWLTAGILGAVGFGLFISGRAIAAKAASADRLLETGASAVAEITDVQRTGSEMNGNPSMRLTLTIIQDDVPLFAVVHKEYVPQHYLGRLQVGARLPVKIDPLDSNNLVIEWDRRPTTPNLA